MLRDALHIRQRARLITLGVSALLFTGCGGSEGAPRAFPDSAPSLKALGETVVTALVAGDTATLVKLRLTEHEHNDIVWPELPAGQPEVNFPIEFAWSNIQVRNRRDLARALPAYRRQELRFQRVECRGEEQQFQTFSVLTDCHTHFEDAEGRALEAQIFKDVLVRGGGHKIFRYYDGDPKAAGIQP